MMGTNITEKCNVIIEKGSYLTACKVIPNRMWRFGRPREGQFSVDLTGVIGHPYGTSFKMVMSSKRKFTLEKIDVSSITSELAVDQESGKDNRDLKGDIDTQNLCKSDISKLRDSGASGGEVVQALTENHRNFKTKTKYSQEKYVSKKKKKYEDVITVYEPTIRLLIKMNYSQDPVKISNLRIDSVSQILSYANVQPGGCFAVYESGTNGLVSASMLKRIGEDGQLIHIYKDSSLQRGALDLMNFKEEELTALSYICADNLPDFTGVTDEDMKEIVVKPQENGDATRPRYGLFTRSRSDDVAITTQRLFKGLDGFIVACKQHTTAITTALLSYLKGGHSFSVFSPYKETLMELYADLKQEKCLNVRLCESWLRNYQILDERTHPEINMSGSGGYILYGWKVMD